MQEIHLDAIDLRLLHALQVEPRASWQSIAPIVGADVATLSRRWGRLTEEGIAWSTGLISGRSAAFVEIECSQGGLTATARALEGDPQVVGLDVTSGSRDLFASVYGKDQQELADYVLGTLSELPGVRTVRTHLVTDVLVDGGAWRLRELTKGEVALIPGPSKPRTRAPRHVSAHLREVVEIALARNGRARPAEIAAEFGVGAQRVSDAIAFMRQSGELILRTDIARAASGWPVYTWYFIEAPARMIDAARCSIAKIPEVRLAVTCSSRYNLVIAVWLHRVADVNRFEIALETAMPGIRIADRSVVLSIRGHLGRTIGADTRVSGPAGGSRSARRSAPSRGRSS